MAGQRVDLTSKLNRGSPSQCGQGKESKGRGLELSELQQFGKRLLAPDDKTGILYSLSWVTCLNISCLADYGLTSVDWGGAGGAVADPE